MSLKILCGDALTKHHAGIGFSMTEQEFKTRFPRASASTIAANFSLQRSYPKSPYKALQAILGAGNGTYEDHTDPELQGSKLKRHKTPALGSAISGKTGSLQRISVRFTGYRTRPLDPDNFAGGCKDLLDGLRHAGLIPGDEPWKIIFETEQIKVAHRCEEKTVIEICDD